MTKNWFGCWGRRLIVLIPLLALFPATTPAQVWIVGGNATVDTECNAVGCPPGPGASLDPPPDGLVPGLFGSDFGAISEATCKNGFSQCHTSASGSVQILVDGIGSPCVRVEWVAVAGSQHSCGIGVAYDADANANLAANLVLVPTGPPDGTPVTVFWRWNHTTTNNYDDPDGLPDHSHAEFGTLTLNGLDLFAGTYDMVDNRGWLVGSDFGEFDSTVGSAIPLSKTMALWVDMLLLPEVFPPPLDDDGELVSYGGRIDICLNTLPAANPREWIEFSADMGSDTSLEDLAPFEGDEVFDPGDMYLLFDGTDIPAPGADGIKDDLLITTVADPAPAAPGPPLADSCSGVPAGGVIYDLDGSDTLDLPMADGLKGLLWPAGVATPLPAPLGMTPTLCIREAESLLVSYEDDGSTNLYDAVCQVPAFDGSPLGETYGSLANQDEVVGLTTLGGPPPVAAVSYPVANEIASHVSMAPNPVYMIPTVPGVQVVDDDVDALDATNEACPTWLFSADGEASIGIPHGSIHRVTPAGVDPFVDPVHLGLPADVELRDFEFVVTTDATGAGVLTLLFTVAPDDPATPAIESGLLDPAMIHASHLTGFNFPFLLVPLSDAVDAITALPTALPAAVPGDTDGDRVEDALDCAPADRATWSIPMTPVENFAVDLIAGGILVSWLPPTDAGGTAAFYDVFRASIAAPGAIPPLFACDGADVAGTIFIDPMPAPLGTAVLFVVRPQTSCGIGPVGPTAGGVVPVLPACP